MRTQRFTVRGVFSKQSPVESGVLQGTVLGPLLFLVYIKDMPQVAIDATLALFAYDAFLYKKYIR